VVVKKRLRSASDRLERRHRPMVRRAAAGAAVRSGCRAGHVPRGSRRRPAPARSRR
jgi:hypothetical protein